MISSLSHLALYGLSNYAEEIVQAYYNKSNMVGPGNYLLPWICIPLSGITNDDLIRDLADRDSSLTLTSAGAPEALQSMWDLFWELVVEHADAYSEGGEYGLSYAHLNAQPMQN